MRPVQRIAIAAAALTAAFVVSDARALEPLDSLREIAANPVPAPAAMSQGLPPAPIGHRQPNARNVPAGVLKEQVIDQSEIEFDRKLQICRRC